MGLKIFSRERIGLRGPREGYAQTGRLTHVSFHHGGEVGKAPRRFADAAATWRSWQRFHQDVRGWNDIGYTFGIDALGRLYEGRPVWALPAAVGNHNSGSIAFVFLMDGGRHRLTWQQRRTLKALFEQGIPHLGVPPLKRLSTHPGAEYGVFGHQEYEGHSTNICPGFHIMRHLRWRRGRYRPRTS